MININGIYWNIYITNDKQLLSMYDGSITLGICDNQTKSIYIQSGLNYDMFKLVLVHELTHAFIFSYGFYLSNDEEEFICEFVSHYADKIIKTTMEIMY